MPSNGQELPCRWPLVRSSGRERVPLPSPRADAPLVSGAQLPTDRENVGGAARVLGKAQADVSDEIAEAFLLVQGRAG